MTTTAQRPLLCRKVVAMLRSNSFSIGDKLPGERRLATMFNTSRNTVREALCNLESMGYLEIREKSGCYLKSKEGRINWEMLRTRKNPAAFRQFVETLALVAPGLARSQAARLTARDMARLEEATVNISWAIVNSDLPTISHRYITFYLTLAEVAGNDYLLLLMKELVLASRNLQSAAVGLSEVQKDTLFALHVELFNALKNRQPDAVEDLAKQCMQVFARLVLPEE
ncbi:GntR family transcriptional regulator [Desulfovibrio sp. Huiquan2017]|uniref:FadR/GntR family transcriptional regulator n=1 Tax=Desulfovibrio sp. Huiquan2017 TaxID=2816861 RepID=UPI0025703EF4|nr:GntR family transcriptional regulator [Desulfovibrio sp. Huiquan2017]